MPPGNSQNQSVVFSEDSLVNSTSSGAQPSLFFTEKPAMGGVSMVSISVTVTEPQAFVAVRVTV